MLLFVLYSCIGLVLTLSTALDSLFIFFYFNKFAKYNSKYVCLLTQRIVHPGIVWGTRLARSHVHLLIGRTFTDSIVTWIRLSTDGGRGSTSTLPGREGGDCREGSGWLHPREHLRLRHNVDGWVRLKQSGQERAQCWHMCRVSQKPNGKDGHESMSWEG